MDQIQKYVPVTQAKTRLLDLVRKLKGSGDAIAITKNGVPDVADRYYGATHDRGFGASSKRPKRVSTAWPI